MLIQGDLDYVSITQGEEMFNALRRLNKDAIFLRYWGEHHRVSSPANFHDRLSRTFDFYDELIGPPFKVKAALN